MRPPPPGWRALRQDRRGAAALEFAVAGTVVMMLLLAAFDIGLLFLAQRGIDYGIYKAARWAAVNSTSLSTANVLAQFKAATSATLGSGNANCQGYAAGASIPAGTACAVTVGLSNGTDVGSVVTVQASYQWSPASSITGFVATTLQASIALTVQH